MGAWSLAAQTITKEKPVSHAIFTFNGKGRWSGEYFQACTYMWVSSSSKCLRCSLIFFFS